ncbi:MAG: hypothetical protein H6742_14245 [Alphaproteobacteria bacterium]|nr:hypothetical protein [Alphaproteobacteria bacterium]
MSFQRWNRTFEGAFTGPSSLEAKGGVYVIWCKKGESWTVLDVGESADVRARVLSHDRKDCWTRNSTGGTLYYSATYTDGLQQQGRMEIEKSIRDAAKPTCGDK